MYVCMHVCMYARTNVPTHVCMYVCMYVPAKTGGYQNPLVDQEAEIDAACHKKHPFNQCRFFGLADIFGPPDLESPNPLARSIDTCTLTHPAWSANGTCDENQSWRLSKVPHPAALDIKGKHTVSG